MKNKILNSHELKRRTDRVSAAAEVPMKVCVEIMVFWLMAPYKIL
jgi:hypothetical protein